MSRVRQYKIPFLHLDQIPIAHGPETLVGFDEDNCLLLGCVANLHCSMVVDYSWFLDGNPLREERKTNVLYVHQPGKYQCVVKVNDHVQKSAEISVIEVDESS